MKELPDVTGYPLEEAIRKCKDQGHDVEILITRPVKTVCEGEPRVVRNGPGTTDKVLLTVVMEDKGKGGG